MKIINKTEDKLVFSVNTNETLANALRRNVNKIPTIAIDEVEISKNDSALYDETVAHRLGLVPLKFKSIKDEVVLKLKVNKAGKVYSKDLKGDIEVAYDKIPITLIEEDSEMNLKAIVKTGIGKDHAKFSPGLVYYRNVCEITMDKMFLGKIKEVFPKNNVKEKGDKIIIEDNLEKPLLDFCEGLAVKNKKKAEVKDKEELIVYVESFGHMKPEDIFKKAIVALQKDLKEVEKKL